MNISNLDILKNSRLAMGLALFVIASYISFENFGGIDWLNINMGEYQLMNDEPVTLISSIGVSWIVGVDALSLPMVWLTALLIPFLLVLNVDGFANKSFAHHYQLLFQVQVGFHRKNRLRMSNLLEMYRLRIFLWADLRLPKSNGVN